MIIVILVVLIVAGLIAGLLIDSPNRNEIRELTFSAIDFNKLRSGTYIGQFQGKKSHLRDTKVKVEILDGELSDVTILKGAVDGKGNYQKLSGGKTIEDIFQNVMKSRSLEVDVVSGATLTSKSHLKALENALEQAQIHE